MSICIHRCDRTPHPSCQSHVGQHKSKSFAASFTPALRSRSVNYSGDYSLIIQRWSLPVVALLICSLWRHVMDDVSFTNFIDIPPPLSISFGFILGLLMATFGDYQIEDSQICLGHSSETGIVQCFHQSHWSNRRVENSETESVCRCHSFNGVVRANSWLNQCLSSCDASESKRRRDEKQE